MLNQENQEQKKEGSMITNGEFVSRVVNGIHALDKDSHVQSEMDINIGRTKDRILYGPEVG